MTAHAKSKPFATGSTTPSELAIACHLWYKQKRIHPEAEINLWQIIKDSSGSNRPIEE
jgi:hypothetical protein